MFLLTLVPIQVHALSDVDLIKNLIRIYYESTVKEDLDTFLDTLSLETEEERERKHAYEQHLVIRMLNQVKKQI